MKMDKWIEFFSHPEKIKEEDLTELEALLNRYPYFQAAQILFLKVLYLSKKNRFSPELKHRSIYIPNHKQFYKYLNNWSEFKEVFEASPEGTEENTTDTISPVEVPLSAVSLKRDSSASSSPGRIRRYFSHLPLRRYFSGRGSSFTGRTRRRTEKEEKNRRSPPSFPSGQNLKNSPDR